ncbi:MAG: hypothetical protein K6E67_10375 [Prevotella sp.]|nr:hypothetical protein [Prevotella sp.]
MKKLGFLALAAIVLTACSSNEDDAFNGAAVEDVTITFSPYQMEAMTRAATSIASVVTRLDVWIIEGNTQVAEIHQTNSDVSFGSVSLTLDKRKTYTIYAVGHKAAGAATLTNGIVAWPDEKVTHAMVYTTTFTPSTTTDLNCEMQRIVGNFRVEVTDETPAEVSRMEIHIGQSPTRWDFTTGGCNTADRTATIAISNHAAGAVNLSTFIIAQDDAATNYTLAVTAYDESDNVIQTRTFEDVPIRNGYRATYRGQFFIDTPMTMTFTVNDWQDYDVVDF